MRHQRARSTFFIFFVLATFIVLVPISVNACTCGMQFGRASVRDRVTSERDNSDAIFVGRILENITPEGALYMAAFRVEVEAAWKGVTSELVTVSTGLEGRMCGYRFEVGATYLIYADGSTDKGYGTSKCTRTAPIGALPDDRQYLGEPNYVNEVCNPLKIGTVHQRVNPKRLSITFRSFPIEKWLFVANELRSGVVCDKSRMKPRAQVTVLASTFFSRPQRFRFTTVLPLTRIPMV